jgi:signal-transduction protein with cAMP-binding, CBS, and nucleotidyltransferase domain
MADAINIPDKLITKTEFFDCKTSMSKVLPSLDRHAAVIINKDNAYYGIVDSHAVYNAVRGLRLSTGESVEKYAVRVPRITNSTSIDDAIYYFYSARVRALPFLHGDKIGGILERKTLLKMLLSLGILESMRVSEAMMTPVLYIDADANVSEAMAAMRAHNVKRLAVMQDGKFYGLVTGHDIMHKFAINEQRLPEKRTKQDYSPSNMPISSVMVSNVMSISQDLGISDAVRQFIENDVSSLVVMKKGVPVGMLTVFDILESIMARRRIQERRIYISGLDSYTYQYQDDLREALNKFVAEVERLHGMRIDYMTVRVKGRPRAYELYVRLSLDKRGIISIHVSNYRFEDAFRDLLKRLKIQVLREKDHILRLRKANTLRDVES